MVYIITFSYITLKSAYDCWRIKRSWGKKDITHYWIDIITGLIWLVGLIWGGAALLDVCVFYVLYALVFSPLINLFRVMFLGHVLGEKWDSWKQIKGLYRWGDVIVDPYKSGFSQTYKNSFPTWTNSKPLIILCYRSRSFLDRWHERIFPGSDLRLRWSLELAFLIIIVYLRS